MSTIPVVSLTSDSWPTIFSHPRNFNRELENKPYLTYLDEIYQRDYESDSGTENSDDESSADGDIGEDEEGNSSPEDESDAVSTAYADDLVVGTFTPIRRFSMKTISEETEYSVPLGGDDPVADFVEHAMETRFKDSNVGALSKSLVALLDVESKTSLDTAARPRRRRAKPFRGGLTRARLQTELEKPRFPTQGSDKLRLTNEVQIYLDRRSIYIPDLDALEMDKLANTATLGQRGGLLNFFHHHVSPSPFIGVIIPSNGFRQFNLHMHLPYFALREQVSLFRDPRKQPNGAPLRGSWVLSCLDTSGRSRVPEDGPKSCLYDAQISMFIVGIEERVWTTIGTADTFFERKGSLNSIKYHHDRRKTGSVAHWQDPISGRVWPSVALNEIDPSFSDPRKYFLSVLDHRVRTVLVEEYGKITGRMEEVVKDW
ncbi:hypothetical protein B0T16DRAFT_249725 [Cercophora newfieldiana]|uniref:Uncharacterized protein n=1 Tax=Cercophora newfieldiana TaxID=92897 RepID=A0AA39XTP8_9PEZI|nr:hypothetical protein B0T16DRAFT_249725 [Cercophora newfieldiana]